MISDVEGKFLVELARKSLETYIKEGKTIKVPDDISPKLEEERGAFVTLTRDGDLRGCIGYPEPAKPLAQAVIEVAIVPPQVTHVFLQSRPQNWKLSKWKLVYSPDQS